MIAQLSHPLILHYTTVPLPESLTAVTVVAKSQAEMGKVDGAESATFVDSHENNTHTLQKKKP